MITVEVKETDTFAHRKTIMQTATEVLNQFYDDERLFMSQSPGEQDPTLLARTMAADIILYQSPDLPYGGDYHGIDEFIRWSTIMGSLWSKVDVQPSKILENGEDVVVLSTVTFQVRKTGKELVRKFAQHIKVDTEAGKIKEFRPFYWDVKGLVDALNE